MMQPSQVQILSAGTTMQLSIVIRIIHHLEQKQKHGEKDRSPKRSTSVKANKRETK